jgi:asparagine synthase (glutamine-hydrolysing)
MCGITGFFQIGSGVIDGPGVLRSMVKQINHRGPDAGGYWFSQDHTLAFGHRRLAVVDVSEAGSQPMTSHGGRYVIVFNGEIYNHGDLRCRLSARGLSWRGDSDTETLLAGFEAWGIEKTIKQCTGMFAFAVWDRESRLLTLGRDRIGEKPLYYGWQGSGLGAVFLFGSELKALRAHPAFGADLCPHALCSFMQNMVVGGTQTIYKGIYKVPPGTLLAIDDRLSSPVVRQYWSVIEAATGGVAEPFVGTALQAVDALEVLLKSVVAQQMTADVPLGAFLSGGVDSSVIAALMQSQSIRPVKTFSIGFREDAYNEAGYAAAVASHLGTEHHSMFATPQQLLDAVPFLSSLYDEPFADSSQIPTLLLATMTRQHVTVALSGDAGDEVFGGYNRYELTAKLWPVLSRVPKHLRKVLAWSLMRLSPVTLDRISSLPMVSRRWTNFGDKVQKGAEVLAEGGVDDLYRGMVALGWRDPTQIVRASSGYTTSIQTPRMPGLSDVERLMVFDALNYLPDDILTKVDRAAMGASLETRVPFLDHNLIEFAWRLPMAYKLHAERGKLVTKWVLRQVLYRYVPQSLIERPKMGFGVPLEHWLRGPLRDWAEDLLTEDRLKREGYLNPIPIRIKWAEHLSGQRNNQHALWCVLMFQTWLEGQRNSSLSVL